MVWPFRSRKHVETLKSEVRDSFNHVKRDFKKVGDWIKHLDDKHGSHEKEIKAIKLELYDISQTLEELSETLSFFGQGANKALSKQPPTAVFEQSAAVDVQTVDQTVDQTSNFSRLTVMERAIVWAILNSSMKLSYEDLAALLGKEKSTIRGQINALKQKNKDLIREVREPTGKKRVYIPEEMREILMKNVKVRVKKQKKVSKHEK